MEDSAKRGTLVVYGEDITLRSGRHMIRCLQKRVTFDAEGDKPLPQSWPCDPPPKLEQLAKRPGVTSTFRTRPAVLTISGITRADVAEIKDTLLNTGPDLGAVELELYLRTHVCGGTCHDLNFFMWRFIEDGGKQGKQQGEGREEEGEEGSDGDHNWSVCSASSTTSDSTTTSKSTHSSPRTEAGDARSTVSAADSSGIGYSNGSSSGNDGSSDSRGTSTGGVPSPERQELRPVVSHTSTDSDSSGHATLTREKEESRPIATPGTASITTTATTMTRAQEKLGQSTCANSISSNSAEGQTKTDKGSQSSAEAVCVDGDEVRVEVVPVDVEQLNGLMKLRDNEENFRIVGRAIRRALVWLGFTERVLFVATGPGAPFSADAVPVHLRSAVLDAVRAASDDNSEERGTAAKGGEQQRGARGAGVGGDSSSEAVGSGSRSEAIGDSKPAKENGDRHRESSKDDGDSNSHNDSNSNSSSVLGVSKTEDGKLCEGEEDAVEVCSGRAVFVLASTDEEALRHVRVKVDDALSAFRLNVPPHCTEVPGYHYLHQAKHDIEEHDDCEGVAEGRGLEICRKPLSLPEPWPKAMESVEMLIVIGIECMTVEEWRGLVTHLPNLRLLVCDAWNMNEVEEAMLANPEERELFLRTTAWCSLPEKNLQKSRLLADADVVAVRRALLLHILGNAITEAAISMGHIPDYLEKLPNGILAYGRGEDLIWGSKAGEELEELEECPACIHNSSWRRCPRCELYEYDELFEEHAPFVKELMGQV